MYAKRRIDLPNESKRKSLRGNYDDHWLTTGAIGMVILGMIARVSLGHSGRPLTIGRPIVVAFVLLILAALLRSLLPLLAPGMTSAAYHASALVWVLAFGIFTWVYWPILTRPRIDGRPG